MAIAHICAQCGWDLARLPPTPEPIYNLLVIDCPRCHCTAVRRRHPIWQSWRTFLRLKTSLLALFAHAFVLCVLVMFNFAVIHFGDEFHDEVPRDILENEKTALIFGLVVIPVVTGTWLTSGLHHVRRWIAWLGWSTFIGLLASIEVLEYEINRYVALPRWIIIDGDPVERWQLRLVVLAAMMIVALAGIPIGHAVLRAYRRHRQHYWRRRRARFRKRRTAA